MKKIIGSILMLGIVISLIAIIMLIPSKSVQASVKSVPCGTLVKKSTCKYKCDTFIPAINCAVDHGGWVEAGYYCTMKNVYYYTDGVKVKGNLGDKCTTRPWPNCPSSTCN
jgi:hypothetical protein